MYKVYVDGQYGTTGLEINKRLEGRTDIELLKMDESKRKDNAERARLINTADIVFLCLPDDASREAVSFLENPNTRLIDASTAHRTSDGWVYGIPELSKERRNEIKTAKKVTNPGCFATGFVALMYPLVLQGIVAATYPVTCNSITGYSGRGKKWIDEFEAGDGEILSSPCFYALELNHKHLPEMQKHSGLSNPPIFTPVIANFYRGMTVAIPLYPHLFGKKQNARELCSFFSDYYGGQKFVKVLPFNSQENFELGFLNATACNNTNNLEILIFGGDERILAVSRLDNLGKGASGAAVQNMNIMLGLNEETGLK